MKSKNIVIFGAGPSGLVLGVKLLDKGFNVEIHEKRSVIGIPQHCSGIVSKKFLDLINLPSNLVVNKLYGVELRVGGMSISVQGTIPKAYVIDRYGYEVWLSKEFLRRGGNIVFNSPMQNYRNFDNTSYLRVDATGVESYISGNRGEVLPGLQLVIEEEYLNGDNFESSLATIIVDKDVNPSFFSWSISVGGDSYKVGTAANGNLWSLLAKIFDVDAQVLRKHSRNRLYGHVIVGGPIKNFFIVEDNIVLIGDSAGQVKITTGGGLYYHLVASDLLVKSLEESEAEYSRRFYSIFGDEIKLQKIFRDVFLKMSQKEIEELVELLSKKEIFNTLLMLGDMDFHMTSLSKLLLDRDLLKVLVKLSKYVEFSSLFR